MKNKFGKLLAFFICVFLISTVLTVNSSAETEENEVKFIDTRAPGVQTIYFDTSGIDARTDLTDKQKKDLKDKILEDVKQNLESAVGKGNVQVTTDAAKKGSASRVVEIKNTLGDGAWGDWPIGSKSVNVYLKEFMDDKNVNDNFKTDGKWDIDKLGNALGHTSGHEVGHTFSIGHNDNTDDKVNKMTKGGNIPASKRATGDFQLDAHSKKVVTENWDKDPCKSAIDYEDKALNMQYGGEPTLPNKPGETGVIDTIFNYIGDLAKDFYFGIFGEDTDEGKNDGNSKADFIYKSSMVGEGADATMISFFEGAHDNTQFALQGTPSSQWDGQLFPLQQEDLTLENFGDGPDTVQVAKNVNMKWDVNADSFFDVFVELDVDAFGENSHPKNGFTYGFVKPSLGEAIDNGLVGVNDIPSTGSASGFIAKMGVDSNFDGDLDVNIRDSGLRGWILVNPNEDEQDEVITGIPGEMAGPKTYTPKNNINFPNSGSKTDLPIQGYCVNIDLKTPSEGTKFTLSPTSSKTDVSYIDDLLEALDNADIPSNFTQDDIIQLTQILIWMGNPENNDLTSDDYATRGYPVQDKFKGIINTVLTDAGQNPDDVTALTGKKKDPATNGTGDKEPTEEESICFLPGFDAIFLVIGILIAIVVVFERKKKL